MSDRARLEEAIRALVDEYERLSCCEVSSVWIEHYDVTRTIEVTVTTRPKVMAA